jgi:ribonuclease J
MKLTFYGGVNEIGGNKILLEEDGTKVYLDFGMPFDLGQDYFFPEQYLEPREADGLAPYFDLELMPKVPKLYSEAMLKHTDLPYSKPDVDAVFVTHHHSDHVGELKFLDESIPVHMGHGTHAIMDAYANLYGSFAKYGEHDVKEFKSGDRIEVGGMTFRPIHVEHSTPGAYGYIIERDGGNMVFTGDLRMHGQAAEMTEEFIDEAKKSNPAVMLCEGTRMPIEGEPDEKNFTEEGVKKVVDGILQDSKGLAFAHFAMSNIDRFRSVWEACCENGRKMVVDPRYAYLLDVMREGIGWIPDCREELCLYYRLNSKGGWDEQPYDGVWRDYYGAPLTDEWFDYDRSGKKRRKAGMWRSERDMGKHVVTYKKIKEKPEEYVLFINFPRLVELAHIKPKKADYIYSSSEHFLEGEENRRMKTVMQNWLRHFDIKWHSAHCSGHAAPADLERMVKKVKPDVLIPIHTLNPGGFRDWAGDVRVVGKGEKIGFYG